ncbi:hypothetical protein B0H14DRAFT_2608401 [Mycena olivaceomarginata]|nr:hypothetical protein B0H14DRAFT_2608401 [Mycena olivaceomarginata]
MPPKHTSNENTDPRRKEFRNKDTHRKKDSRHLSSQRNDRPPLQDANARAATSSGGDAPSLEEVQAELAATKAKLAALEARPQPSEEAQHGPRIRYPAERVEGDHGAASESPRNTAIRYALTAARLDKGRAWKAQDKDCLLAARNIVKEDFPEMKRFVGDWGFDRIAQEAFSGRKSYRKCVDNPNTYCGRTTAARRASRRRRSPSPSSRRTLSPVAGPSGVDRRALTPPSPPPTRSSRGRQVPADDDDESDEEEDDLMDFDEEHTADQEMPVDEDEDTIDFDKALGNSP